LQVELSNGSRILALPSAEANLRGFSAPSMVIIDEASRCDDNLFYSLKPMMAVGNGKLILLSSPFGRRGFFFDVWTNGENWERFTVKATDCERITPEFLQSEKASMPEFIFRQEYLCEFTDSTSQIFPSELIESSINKELKAVVW
jgi:phage FluMu gp28-like protein